MNEAYRNLEDCLFRRNKWSFLVGVVIFTLFLYFLRWLVAGLDWKEPKLVEEFRGVFNLVIEQLGYF